MLNEMRITEARHQLTSLPRKLAKHPRAVTLTRRGKPVLAIMPWEFYDSLVETLEILSDKEFVEILRQGIREAKQGRGIPWEKVKKELEP